MTTLCNSDEVQGFCIRVGWSICNICFSRSHTVLVHVKGFVEGK